MELKDYIFGNMNHTTTTHIYVDQMAELGAHIFKSQVYDINVWNLNHDLHAIIWVMWLAVVTNHIKFSIKKNQKQTI